MINSIAQPVITTTPYPHIFHSQVSVEGHIDLKEKRLPRQGKKENGDFIK